MQANFDGSHHLLGGDGRADKAADVLDAFLDGLKFAQGAAVGELAPVMRELVVLDVEGSGELFW